MGSGGKHRWKISFYRSSARSQKKAPSEFICPISSSLMAEPVIVSSGQTFERSCAQACKDLAFSPLLQDGSRPDFSALIPNLALKSTILNWCDDSSVQRPDPLDPDAARELVRGLMEVEKGKGNEAVKTQTQEEIDEKELLLKGVSETPQRKFFYAATEVNRRPKHFYSELGRVIGDDASAAGDETLMLFVVFVF